MHSCHQGKRSKQAQQHSRCFGTVAVPTVHQSFPTERDSLMPSPSHYTRCVKEAGDWRVSIQVRKSAVGTSCFRTVLFFSPSTAEAGTVSSIIAPVSAAEAPRLGSTAACQEGVGLTVQLYSVGGPWPKFILCTGNCQLVMNPSTLTARRDKLRTCSSVPDTGTSREESAGGKYAARKLSKDC